MKRKLQKSFGFSLTELFIVLVILSVLASIAIPQYQQHVIKTRRIDGKMALLDLAARMERYHAEHQTFIGATLGESGSVLNMKTSPKGFYTLNIAKVSPNTFSLTAIPVGSQLSDDKLCGILGINQLGITTSSGAGKTSQCW